ncbi:MAG: IS30 family transposase [Candidatus Omnitrophota bacterium]
MKKTYKQLNIYERELLSILRGRGESLRDIAKILKRSPSTLSRELQRNTPEIRKGCYIPHRAQARCESRNQFSRAHARLKDPKVWILVRRKLKQGWSPEIIAGWLKNQHPEFFTSHETIYQWIYRYERHWIAVLVRSHRRRLPRGHSHHHRKLHVPERISIKERPKSILARRRIGHWEADTMISRKSPQALQVTVERKSRYFKLTRLTRKISRHMSAALNRRLSHYPQQVRRSITYDNGPENHEHMRTNRVLGTRSYFCEPFHSYEKGTVENTIGLVRRFFPKQTDFATISRSQVQKVERWLNHRPRKCLGFKTPADVFKKHCVALRS